MRTCARFEPLLCRVADGEAQPREAIAVARHLSGCTACRILLARERRLTQLLESDLDDVVSVNETFLQGVIERLPEGPPPRRRRRGLKIAMLAGLAGVALPLLGGLLPAWGGALAVRFPQTLPLQAPALLEAVPALTRLVRLALGALSNGLGPVLRLAADPAGLVAGIALPLGAALMALSMLLALGAPGTLRLLRQKNKGT